MEGSLTGRILPPQTVNDGELSPQAEYKLVLTDLWFPPGHVDLNPRLFPDNPEEATGLTAERSSGEIMFLVWMSGGAEFTNVRERSANFKLKMNFPPFLNTDVLSRQMMDVLITLASVDIMVRSPTPNKLFIMMSVFYDGDFQQQGPRPLTHVVDGFSGPSLYSVEHMVRPLTSF